MGLWFRALGLAAVLGLTMVAAAEAQTAYPTKPVKFVVPFPPGPADMFVRLYSQKLTEQLGQPFVVETRAGATGTIGAAVVAKAPADGYTLLGTVDLPIVKAPNLVKIPYDPIKDLVPLAIVGEDFNMLAVHPSTGIRTATDLVTAAKAKPGSLNFSSAGNGSPGHMCGEMVKGAAGIDMTHVPYQGAGPSLTALLSAEVQVFCGPPAVLAPHIQAGKVTPLGITASQPSNLLPGIAPLSATWPGLSLTNWYGFFAPAGTPAPVVATLRQALRKVFDDAEVRQRLTAAMIEPRWTDGDAAVARIADDLDKWGKVIKAANIKAD
jgi:tripartite-type tricarboxylate transporter receptor subunit TctC